MDKLLFGLLVAVVGLSIVFVCLILLICLFKLMSFTVSKMEGKKKEVKASPVVEKAPVEQTGETEEAVTEENENDEEIVAAITAVMMMLAQEGEDVKGLRVRSVRRVGVNTPAWGRASRGVSGL